MQSAAAALQPFVGGTGVGGASRRVFHFAADQRENKDTPRAFRLTIAAMPMNSPALPESK